MVLLLVLQLCRYRSLMQKSEVNRVLTVTEVALNDVHRTGNHHHHHHQAHNDEDFGPAITRVGATGFLRV